MVRLALVTIRRGNDFICIHDVAMGREFLGLPAATAPPCDVEAGKKLKKKAKVKVKQPATNAASDMEVSDAETRGPSRRARKRAAARRRKLVLTSTAETTLGDEWADEATMSRVSDASQGALHSTGDADGLANINPPDFNVGDRVTFQGLVSRPELTGATGTVHSFDSATGRVAVTVTGMEAIRVRPMNLRRSIFS